MSLIRDSQVNSKQRWCAHMRAACKFLPALRCVDISRAAAGAAGVPSATRHHHRHHHHNDSPHGKLVWHALCPTAKLLLELNQEHVKHVTTEPFVSERKRYAATHPTHVLAFTCMDGRLAVSEMTKVPSGVLVPFRNVAGRFDLGWPKLREIVSHQVSHATHRGMRTLALCTYHFSCGDPARGCRGQHFDIAASQVSAQRLALQFRDIFAGGARAAVIPIVIGIETDTEGFVVHGPVELGSSRPDSRVVLIADFSSPDPDVATLTRAIADLHPGLDAQLLADLVSVFVGNARHVHMRREQNLPILSFKRHEMILAVGTGYDWLHVPNKAMIIGPFDHQWTKSVADASAFMAENIRSGLIDPKDGIVLVASCVSVSSPSNWHWKLAEQTAEYLEQSAKAALLADGHLLSLCDVHVMTGVVERASLRFHPLRSADSSSELDPVAE